MECRKVWNPTSKFKDLHFAMQMRLLRKFLHYHTIPIRLQATRTISTISTPQWAQNDLSKWMFFGDCIWPHSQFLQIEN